MDDQEMQQQENNCDVIHTHVIEREREREHEFNHTKNIPETNKQRKRLKKFLKVET